MPNFNVFVQRFPSQNVSALSREELLKLFSLYAVPKSRRITSNEIDVDMKPVTQSGVKRENGNKRPRHQLITAPTVETVTNACKKIRLINTERISKNNKRHGDSTPMVWNKSKLFVFILTIELTEKINLILIHCRRVTTAKHQSKVNERK